MARRRPGPGAAGRRDPRPQRPRLPRRLGLRRERELAVHLPAERRPRPAAPGRGLVDRRPPALLPRGRHRDGGPLGRRLPRPRRRRDPPAGHPGGPRRGGAGGVAGAQGPPRRRASRLARWAAAALPAGPRARQRDGERGDPGGTPRCTHRVEPGGVSRRRGSKRRRDRPRLRGGPGGGARAPHEAHRRAGGGRRRRRLRGRRLAPARAGGQRALRRRARPGRAACGGLVVRTQPPGLRVLPALRFTRPPDHVRDAPRRARSARLREVAARHLHRPPAPEPRAASLGLGQHLRRHVVRRPPLLPTRERRCREPARNGDAPARAPAHGRVRGGSRPRRAPRPRPGGQPRPAAPPAHGPHGAGLRRLHLAQPLVRRPEGNLALGPGASLRLLRQRDALRLAAPSRRAALGRRRRPHRPRRLRRRRLHLRRPLPQARGPRPRLA